MKIIISPAKKMNRKKDYLQPRQQPACIQRTEQLMEYLKHLPFEELKALLNCSDSIAREAYQNYQEMDLVHNTLPAILAYEGIQYQYMAPQIFEEPYYEYIEKNLRILSGFYGILRPFDAVVPYRLEMQARLKTPFCNNLYDFWGDTLYEKLTEDGDDTVIDLASREYSKAVKPFKDQNVRWIECTFGEREQERVREKGVYVKMARGEMVRYMARHQIENPEEIKDFNGLDYRYEESLSSQNHFVFLKSAFH